MRIRRIWIALSLALLAIVVMPAAAATRDGLVFRLQCDGFTSLGGEVVMNRDNTGDRRESIGITAFDGNGTIIFETMQNAALVGATIAFDEGIFFDWEASPAANPLTLIVFSNEGNGRAAQEVYRAVGTCGGLPFANQPQNLVALAVDAIASPSVPINTAPPTDANVDGTAEQQAGYLIVNTTNAYLRSGDSADYTFVGVVRGGQSLIALGVNEGRTWWFVQAGELRGWINNDLVIVRGNLTDLPIVVAMGEVARPTLFIHIAQPMYNAPNGSPLCNLSAERDYYIVALTDTDPLWYQIEADCDGTPIEGWILAENGSFRNPGNVDIPFGGR
jgi:hypothetical protein